MKNNYILLSFMMTLLSGSAYAGVSINGQNLAPGSYQNDSSGQLIKISEPDAHGNGVGVNVNSTPNAIQKQVNAALCSNGFLRKILPQCN